MLWGAGYYQRENDEDIEDAVARKVAAMGPTCQRPIGRYVKRSRARRAQSRSGEGGDDRDGEESDTTSSEEDGGWGSDSEGGRSSESDSGGEDSDSDLDLDDGSKSSNSRRYHPDVITGIGRDDSDEDDDDDDDESTRSDRNGVVAGGAGKRDRRCGARCGPYRRRRSGRRKSKKSTPSTSKEDSMLFSSTPSGRIIDEERDRDTWPDGDGAEKDENEVGDDMDDSSSIAGSATSVLPAPKSDNPGVQRLLDKIDRHSNIPYLASHEEPTQLVPDGGVVFLEEGDWSSGLFDCMDDPQLCVRGALCPCLLVSEVRYLFTSGAETGRGAAWKCIAGTLSFFLSLSLSLSL